MKPKVSIIIPSYNQSAYLREAIESAINQTVPCEVIVVDDGSTDDSLTIARSYEPKIKVISQVNKGLSSARNTGIMNAKADFILPLDADDVLRDYAVEKLLEVQKETKADIVAPSFMCFGAATQSVVLMPEVKLEDFKDTHNRVGYFSLIRKAKLLEIGGYSPRMVWGYEDMHCTINLLHRGAKLVTVPEILVKYRVKQNSMITTANQHRGELLKIINDDFNHFYGII